MSEQPTNEKLLKIALRCLDLGWSVIPVKPDKRPHENWKEFQHRKASEEEVRAWFEKYPDMLLAVVTGEISNLTVVDMEAGADFSLVKDKTFKVQTGGGGIHWYFQYDPDFRNAVRLLPLTDVRSEGGYVVTIGSETTKGRYFTLDDCPIVKMSKETKELLLSGKAPERIVTTPTNHVATTAEIESDSFFLLAGYEGFGQGQRNEEMTSFIGKVLKRINSVHWDTHAFDIVCKANAKNTPPLGMGELLASFKSIKARESQNIPVHTPLGQNEANSAVVTAISDGSDDVKHLATVAAEQKINQEDIYPLEMPCFDELIMGGASPGDLVVIAGQTGEGKTSLAQDWTLSFIRGPKKAPVLWFSYEVLPTHLWRKFQTMGMTEEDVAVIPAKHSSGNVVWVEEKIKEAKAKFGIKVVMIDHLGFLLPKTNSMTGKNMSSNYASFVTQIVRDIKTLALQEEVIIVLPVHMRKTEKSEMTDIKDSVGISQESDLVFLIARERAAKNANSYFTDFTQITLAKNRKTGQTHKAWFTMVNERFAYSDRNEHEQNVEKLWNNLTSETAPPAEDDF